jgi:anti-sigma-K factor RskA
MAEPREEETDLLAAEYSLGLLEGEERLEAERRAARDTDFAALVDEWNERLGPLLDSITPVAPDRALWDRIRVSLEEPDKRPVELAAIRKRLNLWKGYSAAVTAIAASLLLVVGLRTADQAPVPQPAPAAARPIMVATLAPETGPASLTASYDPGSNSLVVAPADLNPVPGHDHELWIIPDDGKPRSLGLVAASQQGRMQLPADMPAGLIERATIALSAEPSGGSPTGQPTGPVVASGKFSRV